MAGTGRRARAWYDVIAHAARLRLVEIVERHPGGLTEAPAPRSGSLERALAEHPRALVAAALPPRAALEAARVLCEAGRRGVVEAPLALEPAWPEPSTGVQVAHGWVTLPGRRWTEQLLSRAAFDRIALRVSGLPETPDGDGDEVLVHALALALRLAPEARLLRADAESEARTDVVLETPELCIELRAEARGHALDVEIEGVGARARWSWRPHEEIRELSARTTRHATLPAEVRALRQLVDPERTDGDDLARAARVRDLAREIATRIPGRAPARRVFAHSARLASVDPLAALGLSGELPSAPPAVPDLDVPLPPEPLELWAFRAGLKPVLFLTLAPDDEARARDWVGGAHVERRERRVATDAQDAWTDRRDRGEPRVELFVSRDPTLARRAAELQAHADPGASIARLGALMGYPACCVQAFAGQVDRSNNSRNRYATAARTPAPGPWHWQLANSVVMLVPFFPCSYLCPRALAFARATLSAAETEHAGLTERLRDALAHPVLYFLHQHALSLRDARVEGRRAHYRSVAVDGGAPPAFRRLAGTVAAGTSLSFGESALEIDGVATLRRVDPALGLLMPFGG